MQVQMNFTNQLKLVAGAAVLLLTLNAAQSADMAHAVLKDKDGKEVGTVELTPSKQGVQLRLSLTGVPAGERAFHIHENGKCEPPGFQSAGGHFNPEKKKHGKDGPDVGHAGDMPNLNIPANGQLKTEVVNTAVTLEKGRPNSVFRDGGTSIVIHQGADDYKTDPAGNAGDRIACGVITEAAATAAPPAKK
jgi:Cu-Zn family superoxide dismutase